MLTSHRADAIPPGRPTLSSSGNRPRSVTPRTSSEHGTICSDETQRTSFTDEAQACFNILLILRHDTQSLIASRNENLFALEDVSALTEGAASSRHALIACINESIIAATRSIAELGPFLDRYRWPAATEPTTHDSQRRSLPFTLKPRRRKSKSCSGLPANPHGAESGEIALSSQEMFAWTLALTAQHTAVLVAAKRLDTFLESGVSNVSEEETKRREARQSWWEQGRGEFENVGLIQSLLGGPRRRTLAKSSEQSEEHSVEANPALLRLENQEPAGNSSETLTPIMESDDWRSETQLSFTPATLAATPKGLTAPPRQHHMGSLQEEERFSVRRVFSEPLNIAPRETTPTNDAKLSRMETFGSEKPAVPLSRWSSSRQRPRIAIAPLVPVVSFQNPIADHEREHNTTNASPGIRDDYLSTKSVPSNAQTQPLTPPFTPNAQQVDSTLQPSAYQTQQTSSTSPSETLYTPYTPLNPSFTSRFTQRALTLPSDTTLHSITQQLDNVTISPDQGARNVALYVSPVEAGSRTSVAPVIEGTDNSIVSPLESESSTLTQGFALAVSPLTVNGRQSRTTSKDEESPDDHKPWLEYMSRKKEVAARKWSLKKVKASEM